MLDLMLRDGAIWFAVPALAGTTVFVFRLILMLLGVVESELAQQAGIELPPALGRVAQNGDNGHAGKG